MRKRGLIFQRTKRKTTLAMIKKLKITKIFFNSQSKDGKPYISKKNGHPYKLVTIYWDDQGQKSAGGFAFSDSPVNQWKIGDEVVVELSDREWNGRKYLDFKPVSQGMMKLVELEERVDILEAIVLKK